MGIDYSGGMIVGAKGDELTHPDEFDYMSEWAEEHDMDYMSPWYDADEKYCVYGFSIPAKISMDDLNDDWLEMVKEKAAKFEEITGVKPQLIAMQNISWMIYIAPNVAKIQTNYTTGIV